MTPGKCFLILQSTCRPDARAAAAEAVIENQNVF